MILRELADFEEKGYDDQKLRRAAAELLDRQFIHAADRGMARHYNAIIDDKYWRYFQSLFDALGRRLIRNDSEQWVGVLPEIGLYPDVASALPRMRQGETALLLVMALIYQEKINQGEVEGGAVVRTDTGELFDRYTTLLGRERIKEIEFRDLTKEARRRGIIAYGERDDESQDFEVLIRPIIKFVVSDDVRAAMRQFLGDQEQALDEAGVKAIPQAETVEQAGESKMVTSPGDDALSDGERLPHSGRSWTASESDVPSSDTLDRGESNLGDRVS